MKFTYYTPKEEIINTVKSVVSKVQYSSKEVFTMSDIKYDKSRLIQMRFKGSIPLTELLLLDVVRYDANINSLEGWILITFIMKP